MKTCLRALRHAARWRSWSVLLSLSSLDLTAFAAGDAVHGKQLYQSRCVACHSLDYNGVGPMHRGVFGRAAGSVQGYAYSKALAQAGVKWDERTLDRWLAGPELLVPGQRMGVSVQDPSERADLIAFLKTLGTTQEK